MNIIVATILSTILTAHTCEDAYIIKNLISQPQENSHGEIGSNDKSTFESIRFINGPIIHYIYTCDRNATYLVDLALTLEPAIPYWEIAKEIPQLQWDNHFYDNQLWRMLKQTDYGTIEVIAELKKIVPPPLPPIFPLTKEQYTKQLFDELKQTRQLPSAFISTVRVIKLEIGKEWKVP